MIVLVGAGHANLQVLERACRERWSEGTLALVTPYPEARYPGFLPGSIAGLTPDEEGLIPLEPLCRRAGAHLLLDRVMAIDLEKRQLHLATARTLAYEWCSLDVGSMPAGLDTPGVLAQSITSRPVDTLMKRLDAAWVGDTSTIAVVGGGAGAVELALALRHRYGNRMFLFEAGERLLPNLAPRAGRLAERVLLSRRIEVNLNCPVKKVQPGGLHADGQFYPADLVLWATGPAAPDWLQRSGLDCDEQGFVLVRPTLQTLTSERVFAAGDCASLAGRTLPKSGASAARMGEVLAHNIHALVERRPFKVYRPQPASLALLSLGDGRALGSYGRFAWVGRWAMRWKRRLDQKWVQRFRV